MSHPDELLSRAIAEPVALHPYDPAWPAAFVAKRARLTAIAPELLAVEHIGSTAVPGLSARPIIDILAAVSSLHVADLLLPRLCADGYVTSPEYNLTLPDRRWLMGHAIGRRTHHLHLLPLDSPYRTHCLRFRDHLRQNPTATTVYAALKRSLATTLAHDRQACTHAKSAFITATLE